MCLCMCVCINLYVPRYTFHIVSNIWCIFCPCVHLCMCLCITEYVLRYRSHTVSNILMYFPSLSVRACTCVCVFMSSSKDVHTRARPQLIYKYINLSVHIFMTLSVHVDAV